MSDKSGVKLAAHRRISLGPIGHHIVLENEHVRVWEVRLAPARRSTSTFTITHT
ncbi:MAG: hypothetical protein QOD29_652 [Alphaproteobacteria bacterium]|jgi:hypothetical protein|nr:hypothetical protein [Alphaproteobacteria bacterium]